VYYKICDGFVLIIDPLRIESIQFIENQIEKIIKNSSNLNFFLIANIKFSKTDDPERIKFIQRKFVETDYHIKRLTEKHDIKVNYIDISNIKIFKNSINKFISLTYIKKGLYYQQPPLKNKKLKKGFTLGNNRRSMNYLIEADES
jgi:hypothetical protein